MSYDFDMKGQRELIKMFDRLPGKVKTQVSDRGLLEAGLLVEGHLKKKKLSGQSLKVRSGRLRSSVTTALRIQGKDGAVHVGPRVKYAKIHETGGMIKPTRSRYLTVPTRYSLTAAGVPRWTAREIISDPSRGGFSGTFFAKKMLFGKKGSGRQSRIVPLFALKTSIHIKARPFMEPTMRETKKKVVGIFAKHIKRALKI